MQEIKKTKYRKIAYKIIDYQTLRKLCNAFEDLKVHENDSVNLKVYAEKEEVYTSDSCYSLLELESDIMHKVISGANLVYYGQGKEISLSLVHQDVSNTFIIFGHIDSFSFDNRLRIEGTDESWVDSTFIKINGLIDSFKNQNSVIHRYNRLFLVGLSIFLVTFFLLTLQLANDFLNFIPNTQDKSDPTVFEWMGIISFFIVLGIIPAYEINSRVVKLWPIVEFQLCREHMRIYEIKRRNLYIIISVFLVPMVFFILS